MDVPDEISHPDHVEWGDALRDKLTALHITEESYIAFKEKVGLLPECNCEARRIWLNNFGQEFGKKKKKLLRFLLRD